MASLAAAKPLFRGFDAVSVRGFLANALILAGFPILIGVYLLIGFGGSLELPNVLAPSAVIIVLSMAFLGMRALTVTPFDYLFALWTVLAIASHIYATEVLNRPLAPNSLYINGGFILSMILMFRAVFCLVSINPPFATRVFFATIAGWICFAALLGLVERYGPDADLATRIAARIAPLKSKVEEGATVGRPTSVFSGPNLLGFAVSVLACLSLAWGLTDIRRIGWLRVLGVLALFALAAMCALSSQSRSTFLLIGIFPVAFGFQLRRRAKNQANTAVFGIALAVGVFGLLFMLGSGRFDYMTSVRHTGVEHDVSYSVRMRALSSVAKIAPEIAVLGSGISQSNNPHNDVEYGFDRYATIGVDNEWVNAFEAFGVWGPLFLVLLIGTWAAQTLRLRRDPRPEAQLVYYASLALLALVLIVSPGVVRLLKYDTAGYSFAILAAVSAWTALPVVVINESASPQCKQA